MKLIDFDQLNAGIGDLLQKYRQLQQDNGYLKQRESKLIAENRQLHEQVEHARQKISEIIARLKSIEDNP